MSVVSVVLSALDNSLATNPVLATARALARLLGAHVEAIHVLDDGAAPSDAARAAGVPLRLARGPVVEALVTAARADGVAVVVVGARGTVSSDHSLGSTAMAVVAELRCPVVVVPPAGRVTSSVRRVLLPLSGASSDDLVPYWSFRPAHGAIVDVLAEDLHGDGNRVGATAQALDVDLIALGWTPTLSALRTPIVQAALTTANVPVMLIPVHERAAAGKLVSG